MLSQMLLPIALWMSTEIQLPDPPLQDPTAGIILRSWEAAADDAAALAKAWSDPGIAAETRPPADRSTDAAEDWISGEPERRRRGLALDLVITDMSVATASTVLGEVGLAHLDDTGRAEIGFWLMPGARGTGAATAAVRLVTRWALSDDGLGRRQVWARVRPGNRQAEAVLSRASYRRLGETCGYAIWSCFGDTDSSGAGYLTQRASG